MSQESSTRRWSNRKIALVAVVFGAAMLLLSLFSAPLYRAFCRATGFGGSPVTVTQESTETLSSRTMTIHFNYDEAAGLPWKITAPPSVANLPVGKSVEVAFVAENLSDRPITSIASFNVTPTKISPYFDKIQCFCFDRQTLKPHERKSMGIRFFIDPKIVNDQTVAEVSEVTLNYSFFEAKK
ncbi:MAG: cytochrome c oxidase assembly protein [Alphaproteobacteria bacterium]|nr:cytochrome c oxidase assembly protein [Alphaproteobacteria bacterium]